MSLNILNTTKKIYLFEQNNSHGRYVEPAQLVLVLARTAEEANEIAIEHGIYFDGVKKGIDCPCCYNRWDRATEKSTVKSLADLDLMNLGQDSSPWDPDKLRTYATRILLLEKEMTAEEIEEFYNND